MARGAPFRSSHQVARKSARGKHLDTSLAVIYTALAESPLPERNSTMPDVQENNPTVAETIPRSSRTEDAPPQNLSSSYLALIRVPSGPTPSPNICKGGISDGCFQNIVELFAKRYITTFDKDRLALEGAYLPESTFSCRYIPISRSPPPDYLSKCNIGILQGHSPIIQAISSFSQRIVFAPPRKPTSNITIDALQLPGLSYFITMVFDTIIEDVDVSVDMIFLLKESARLTGKRDLLRVLWSPFVVISHQIILRS